MAASGLRSVAPLRTRIRLELEAEPRRVTRAGDPVDERERWPRDKSRQGDARLRGVAVEPLPTPGARQNQPPAVDGKVSGKARGSRIARMAAAGPEAPDTRAVATPPRSKRTCLACSTKPSRLRGSPASCRSLRVIFPTSRRRGCGETPLPLGRPPLSFGEHVSGPGPVPPVGDAPRPFPFPAPDTADGQRKSADFGHRGCRAQRAGVGFDGNRTRRARRTTDPGQKPTGKCSALGDGCCARPRERI